MRSDSGLFRKGKMEEQAVSRLAAALADRYVFERELGRGGMASVHLARDKKHARLVAVKVLSPEYTTALGVERFLREIQITAGLQHPNVLQLIDSGEAAGLCYYVMPYVEGESLRDRLVWRKTLPVAEAVRIAREIAGALAYAHARDVVHRDVKPENILLSDGHAVVADFGIARAARKAREGSLTVSGIPIGTPAYMSPEQARGSSVVDGKSDLYSLACVLYEMLTGAPPFVGTTAEAVIQKHLLDVPEPAARRRSGLPAELSQLLDRALAKEPEDRPTLAELDDVLSYLDSSGVLRNSGPGAPTPAPQTPWSAPTPSGRSPIPYPTPITAEPTLPTASVSRDRRWLARGVSIAAVALLVLGFVVVRPYSRRITSLGGSSPEKAFVASVAAMPLDTIGNDQDGAILSEGLTEEIISQLSRINGLKVISRTSVVAIKAKKLTVPEIAKALDVKHVLEGSVQRSGNKLRVTLQLIEADRDAHVWTETYDREITDVFALREEIGHKVSSALAANVKGLVAAREKETSKTGICVAYDSYLEGRYCFARPTKDTMQRGIAAFEKSIDTDPKYAPPYAGLSQTLVLSVMLGYRGVSHPYPDLARAARLADQATKLDPNLGDAHLARAMVEVYAGSGDVALPYVERALKLVPNAGSAHLFRAMALASAGRANEAVASLQTASELDPMNPGLHGGGIAMTALAARQYDLALKEARRSTVIDPGWKMGHLTEALALLLLDRAAECDTIDLAAFPVVRAMCLHSLGRVPEAEALVAAQEARFRTGDYDAIFEISAVSAYYAWTGDAAKSLDWARWAYELSPIGVDFRVVESGLYDRIRKDPAVDAELRRLRAQVHDKVFKAA